MTTSHKRFFGISAFIVSLTILYALLIVGQMKISASEQVRFELPPDSPEAKALTIIQNEINPRDVARFGINGRTMSVTYPIKQSLYMGNVSPIASEMELLRISCQLRDAGYVEQTFQFLITMPTKQHKQVDGYAISLDDDTIEALDCNNLQDVKVPDIAEQYEYLYMSDTKQ